MSNEYRWLFGGWACDDIRIHTPLVRDSCCPELFRLVDAVRELLLPPGRLSCADAAPEAYRRTCARDAGPNYGAALVSTLGTSGHLAARAMTGNWDGGLLYWVLPCVPEWGRLLRLVYTFALLRGPQATLGSCLLNAYPDWCRCNRVLTGLNPCAWQWREPGAHAWNDYPPAALRSIQKAVAARQAQVRVGRSGRWRVLDLSTRREVDERTGAVTADVRSNDQTSVLGVRVLAAPVGYRL